MMKIDMKDLRDIPIIALTTWSVLMGNQAATNLALCILWLFVLCGATGVFAYTAICGLIRTEGIESLSKVAKMQVSRAKEWYAKNGNFDSIRMRAKVFVMASPFCIMATAGYIALGVIGCLVVMWFLAARMTLAQDAIEAESEKPEESDDE